MRLILAICDLCGALAVVPDDHAHNLMKGIEVIGDLADNIVVSRCATVRELDVGGEACRGDMVLSAVIGATPLLHSVEFLDAVVDRAVELATAVPGKDPYKVIGEMRELLSGIRRVRKGEEVPS